MKKNYFKILLATALLITFFSSCGKDNLIKEITLEETSKKALSLHEQGKSMPEPGSKFTVSKKDITIHNWMSFIPDDTRITSLSISGTHNSAQTTGSAWLVKCQDLGTDHQLLIGTRYFDIRVDDNLAIKHNGHYQKVNGHFVTFGDFFNECKSFLRENPSEVILIHIKGEKAINLLNVANGVARIIEQNEDYFWNRKNNGTPFPTLGEARGKIIILPRMDRNQNVNVISKSGKTNKLFDYGVSVAPWADNRDIFFAGEGQNVVVQDRYNPGISPVGKKKNLVNQMIFNTNNQSKNLPNLLFINYASIAANWSPITTTGKEMNNWLISYLPSLNSINTGIIACDLITSPVSSAIIKTN